MGFGMVDGVSEMGVVSVAEGMPDLDSGSSWDDHLSA